MNFKNKKLPLHFKHIYIYIYTFTFVQHVCQRPYSCPTLMKTHEILAFGQSTIAN
jgi:hypothetical protein